MESLRTIKMTIPPPTPIDWTSIGTWALSVIGILIAFFGFTNKYFKDKASEREAFAKAEKEGKQEFIEKIVNTTVTATLNSVLGAMREDISTLFKYREDDRNHSDSQFKELMREIKK